MSRLHPNPDEGGAHRFLSGVRRNAPPGRLMNARTGQAVADAAELALTSASRRRGLLGRDRLDPGAALVIAPCNSIHTFFMRFAIDVAFVDRDGQVLRIKATVRPWRLAVTLRAFAVVELAAGELMRAKIQCGDRLLLARE